MDSKENFIKSLANPEQLDLEEELRRDHIVKENLEEGYQYTRIDLVKIAYMAMIIARRQMQAMSKVVSAPLPQKIYHTRKSHKSMDFIAKKTGVPRKPKYIALYDKLLAAQQNYMKAQANFEGLAKELTKQEQAEITGTAYPTNALADTPILG